MRYRMCKKNRIVSILLAFAVIFIMSAVDIPYSISRVKAASARINAEYAYPEICMQGCVENKGWMDETNDGVVGTTGQALSLEAFKIGIINTRYQYMNSYKGQIFVNAIGRTANGGARIYQDLANCGSMTRVIGTEGKSLPLIAITISITGEISNYFHVEYRIHVENEGWKPWVKDGEITYGSKYQRIEALEVRLKRYKMDPRCEDYIEPDPYKDTYYPDIFDPGFGPERDDLDMDSFSYNRRKYYTPNF